MTDKLKCPFCGAELVGREDAYGNVSDVWLECPNDEVCEHAYTAMRFDVWQALIDGKAAQDALKSVSDDIEAIIHEWNTSKKGVGASARVMCVLACHAQDTIASITTGKDKY